MLMHILLRQQVLDQERYRFLPFIMVAGQQFDPGLQILDLQRTIRVQP